jgi:hypothetical protein
MTDAEQIAAFIAARGVTKCATGDSALNLSAKEWRAAARSPERVRPLSEEDKLIQERHTVVDHLGRVRVCNGLGEWVA